MSELWAGTSGGDEDCAQHPPDLLNDASASALRLRASRKENSFNLSMQSFSMIGSGVCLQMVCLTDQRDLLGALVNLRHVLRLWSCKSPAEAISARFQTSSIRIQNLR